MKDVKTVNTHEAKAQFSRLLWLVAAGEEITIANRGVPIAPASPSCCRRQAQDWSFRKPNAIPEEFDDTLSEELLAVFEGKPKQAKNKV